MARVTVEDCVDKIPSRFELVMMASQRARKISSGSPLTIERDNDKNTVVSLREIAAETVNLDNLKEELIRSHQRMLVYEEDEDTIDLMDGEAEWEMVAKAKQSGEGSLYSGEEISEEDMKEEPSLKDLAGNFDEGDSE